MHAPEDSPPISHDRVRRRWLAFLGVALALSLLATGYVQWRQMELLDSTAPLQDDALGWSFFELETEHLRWRNDLLRAVADPAGGAGERLALRREAFVGRLHLVDNARAAQFMRQQPAYAPAMAQLRRFVSDADRLLAPGTRNPQAWQALLAEQDMLNTPLHELSIAATHVLAERDTRHNEAVRAQGKLGIALTFFQSVLLLVFAFIVLTQLRALQQRRDRLAELATRLRAAHVDAESASRAKSMFLANMSHEIRTPFHGLLGMLSLLQETPLTAQQAGYLGTAKDSANHLLAVLNDILDISKLEAGNLQVVPEAVDLARLVREVDAVMRVQAQSKGLALHVSMDADAPRWVRADPTRLKQILFNLLSNAVKFTAVGHVHLKVEAGSGAGAGQVVFSVIDTGIGMDEATQARVFKRFVQGDGTTSRRHGGAGLGLEISRSLARLMNGDITVHSAPGEGSRFVLSVPLPCIGPPAPGTPTTPTQGGTPGRQLKVLVAEDHPVNRLYLEAVLDKLGHQAVFAENGEEAVRAAQAEDFDVVLMDLHMPVMDGFAAARAIRALPLPRGAMPIVALTADAFQDSQERARQAGMDDTLTKPAHLPQLRGLLARYGGATTAPAAAPAPAEGAGHSELVDRATVEQLHASLSPQQYAALLVSFFEAHTQALQRLREAVEASDRASVWNQAHALKGAALSLGLRAVVVGADDLMQAAHQPTRPPMAPLLDALQRQLAITRDLCRSLGWLPAAPSPGETVR
jgi:signal transduction histidine kinase/DNA-binding response OmpR family regulator